MTYPGQDERKLDRVSLINYLIAKNGYRRYLEIGVAAGATLAAVQAAHKDGVDPAGNCNHVMTSDAFFAEARESHREPYDLIYIDGLHVAEQVMRDVDNALDFLTERGTIVLHDCNPPTEAHQTERNNGGDWNGTVWQAVARLRCERDDLSIVVVDTDWGLGIVRRGAQELFRTKDANPVTDYAFLKEHRVGLLNLISEDDFLARY